MPKLYALTKIIMPKGDVIERRTVFDATIAQAKQFDALKAARPATEAEIKIADREQAKADGIVAIDDENAARPAADATLDKPESGAPGDPQNRPKTR